MRKTTDLLARKASAFAGALLLTATLVAAPGRASAQDADFLFGAPNGSLLLKFGWAAPRAADGDPARQSLWAFTREHLTVDEGAFSGPALSGELAFRLNSRADAGLSFGFTSVEVHSEYREWVGEDDLPIAQSSQFRTIPLTLTLRGYPIPRGRSISSLAWIPSTVNPYVGVALGYVWYTFTQEGEFVDYQNLDIFRDRLASRGGALTAQVMAGTEVSLGKRLFFLGEARYAWGRAPLDPQFSGFPDLDLSGGQLLGGIGVRY